MAMATWVEHSVELRRIPEREIIIKIASLIDIV